LSDISLNLLCRSGRNSLAAESGGFRSMMGLFGKLRGLGVGLLGLAAMALILLIQSADPAPVERIRMLVFDSYQALAPRATESESKVAIIDIDERSIELLGQWPWPRSDLATLTERLGQAGAQAVVFDIVFSESDRTSPEEVAARLATSGEGSDIISQLERLPSNDDLLAESFASVPVVTAYFLDQQERPRPVEPKANFTLSGSLPDRDVASYRGALQPLPELEQAASGNGFVSLESDSDGIVRRVPLVALFGDTPIPSLSLEALRISLDAGSPNLLTSDGSGETLSSPGAAVAIRLAGLEIPVNDAGEMWVHFPPPSSDQMIPAAPIITGQQSDAELASRVAGKIVLVGGSATGLQDLVSTPLSDRIAGVTVHAAALEQMLSGDFLQRPDWAYGLELVAVFVLGLAASLLLPRMGALLGALLAVGTMTAVVAASWIGFVRFDFLLDPTYPVLVIAVIYSVQTVAVYYREEQQRSYIRSAFDRYLSPEMVRQIAHDPSKLELGGEEREMSVMMCDIRGFSRISEQYEPREVIDFLIEFLTPMSTILLDHRATLDKYIGDAILAFWNAPLDDPDHHRNAARAALAMTNRLTELNASMPLKKNHPWPGEVKIGIGLNSGLCCVGNMGSRQRLNYSLIGDTVNVAARLEGLTKQYGVKIMVGEDMAAELEGFALLEVDRVRVVGREGAETIFTLLGDEALAADDAFAALAQAHTEMLAAYRAQDWERVTSTLAASRARYEAAGITELAELMLQRANTLRANPPGADWDGVYQATQK
jgi:adenylate cyclase